MYIYRYQFPNFWQKFIFFGIVYLKLKLLFKGFIRPQNFSYNKNSIIFFFFKLKKNVNTRPYNHNIQTTEDREPKNLLHDEPNGTFYKLCIQPIYFTCIMIFLEIVILHIVALDNLAKL